MKPWYEYVVQPDERKDYRRSVYTSEAEEKQLNQQLLHLFARKEHSLRFDILHELGIVTHPHAHTLIDIAQQVTGYSAEASAPERAARMYGICVSMKALLELPKGHVLVSALRYDIAEDLPSTLRPHAVNLMRAIHELKG